MNDRRRAQMLDQLGDTLAVSNVEFVMHEIGDLADQALPIHSRIAQGAKKNLALIVVDPVDCPTLASKEQASLRAGKAGRTGDQNGFQGATPWTMAQRDARFISWRNSDSILLRSEALTRSMKRIP